MQVGELINRLSSHPGHIPAMVNGREVARVALDQKRDGSGAYFVRIDVAEEGAAQAASPAAAPAAVEADADSDAGGRE